MRPRLGRYRPEAAFRREVLPAPFGPTIAKIFPWGMSIDTPASATTPPNRRCRSSTTSAEAPSPACPSRSPVLAMAITTLRELSRGFASVPLRIDGCRPARKSRREPACCILAAMTTALDYLKDAPPRIFYVHVHYPWRDARAGGFSPEMQAEILAYTCRRLSIR